MIEATAFTPWLALAGGALIGLAAVLLMATLGRVAGISGILGQALSGAGVERTWRLAFLAGLLLAAWVVFQFVAPAHFTPRSDYPVALLIVAGLLVGYGTSLGSGCTSGHGVCGLARLSPRSLAATLVFMGVGVATAVVLRHAAGWLS
jgi:uncharacterized membrane protein YedE/YeeE